MDYLKFLTCMSIINFFMMVLVVAKLGLKSFGGDE